jgi:hypothetical protein
MKQTKFFIILVFAVLFPGLAMTADVPQTKDEAKAAMKKDKTGTNPINFTNDARIYHEFSNLETSGDGEQSVTTLEFRTPFNDGKWQFRTRLRVNSLEVDTNNDGVNDVDDTGIGVVDMRLLTVPYLNMKKKLGIATGLELFLPTGNAVTGSQTTSLGPQVFGVFFLPFGISNSIVAPAVQYKFSVDEEQGADEVEQFLFDVFFLKTFGNKQLWALINPQYVIDQEQDVEFGFLDVELGMMLDKYLGTKGNSIYVRPSIGWGTDKVTESGFEVGYKVVW